MNPAACVILVPAAQYIEPACERGLRQLEANGYPVWRVYGYAAIDVGRSHIATRALREGFDELMWIDADIAFDPTAIDRLRSHNLGIGGHEPILTFWEGYSHHTDSDGRTVHTLAKTLDYLSAEDSIDTSYTKRLS